MLLGPPPRSRRRRRSLGIVALLTVVAFVVVLVGGLRSDRRLLAGYVDLARLVVGFEAGAADSFVDVTRRLDEMERLTLLAALNDSYDTLATAAADLAGAEVPSDAGLVHAHFVVATDFWKEGVDAARRGILAAVDAPADPLGRMTIEQAMLDLRSGDAAYLKGIGQLEDLESMVDVAIPEFPAVRFAPAEMTGGVLADRAAQATGLALRADLGIAAVRLDPPSLSERADGAGIVPLTDTINVQVTALNNGNESEGGVPLELRMSQVGRLDQVVRTSVVGELAPSASATVDFDLPVEPGGQYRLEITLGLADGDVDVANNLVVVPFVVNAETP